MKKKGFKSVVTNSVRYNHSLLDTSGFILKKEVINCDEIRYSLLDKESLETKAVMIVRTRNYGNELHIFGVKAYPPGKRCGTILIVKFLEQNFTNRKTVTVYPQGNSKGLREYYSRFSFGFMSLKRMKILPEMKGR